MTGRAPACSRSRRTSRFSGGIRQRPTANANACFRLLIEDVTLLRGKEITAHVRFRGGAAHTLTLPRPSPAWKLRQIDPAIVSEIDRLLDTHTDDEIGAILRERRVRTYEGAVPSRLMVRRIRLDYGLKSRFDRLRGQGMLTRHEIAKALGVAISTVKDWRRKGWLRAVAYDDKGNYLYDRPGPTSPEKFKWKQRVYGKPMTQRTKGVQCEA